ncbi:MAG: type II secretion system protein [Limisphaerales bacterium]
MNASSNARSDILLFPRMDAAGTPPAECLKSAAVPRPLAVDARRRRAFTLIELLVTISIIAILASLGFPALARAKEKARVIKVHAELYGLGLALQMYSDDHAGRVPPVRVNCNSDLATHWCQLPVELADQRYLPRHAAPGREADLEDPFARGHTYKYAAPGPQLLNGEPVGHYELWVSRDFPTLDSEEGEYHRDPATCPVRWVVWSQGPRPLGAKNQSSRAPMSAQTWYRRAGDDGVIVRFADQDGLQRKSP